MRSQLQVAALLGLLSALGAHTAHADVVVIVSAKASVASLSAQQITDIFLGRSFAMRPLDNADKSQIRDRFCSGVLGKDDAQIKAIWGKLVFSGRARPPKLLPSDAEVVKAVAAGAESIGYVEKSSVDSSVKVIFEAK